VSTHAEIRRVSPVSGQSIGTDSAPGRNRRTKLANRKAGYLGHRETHALLSQEPLNQHHTEKIKFSLVLFDEIEKA
jgi:hypothetical protein